MHSLRDLLRPNDWIGKIDLKDAYFGVLYEKIARNAYSFFR